jgi:hypothetical protein
MMRHYSLFSCAGPGWAVIWNRELAAGLSSSMHAHIGAMTRKQALRAQQLSFSSAGRSPYMRAIADMRRLPG